MRLLYLLFFMAPVLAEWEPELIFGPQNSIKPGQCEMFKVTFLQNYFQQYIEYKINMPSLKELTLCFWIKFHSHSGDHPIFSYAVHDQPRALYSWVSNDEKSSYFSMAVDSHTFFRLNYPLRLKKWYHVCESWNGKTGEWQIWVNAERVGRGFHNRLVGHKIPGGGQAITGQELQKNDEKESNGLQGEITMVQLYGVALTAGKAHKDHKHHHAHQYDHNGQPITTPAPTTQNPRPTLPTHPLLTAGQINPALRLNIAGAQNQPQPPQPQIVPGQKFNVQYVNGQFVGNLVSEQLSLQNQQQIPQPRSQPVLLNGAGNLPNSYSSQTFSVGNLQLVSNIDHSAVDGGNYQLLEPQRLFKREPSGKTKRQVIGGGTIFEESFGLASIGENQPVLYAQKQEDEREPAEAEVKAVMNICSGCDEEPFEKALILGWRTVSKQIYGVSYSPAVPQCKVF